MITLAGILIFPFLSAVFTFFSRSTRYKYILSLVAAVVHSVTVTMLIYRHLPVPESDWFIFDPLSQFFLVILSIVNFFVVLVSWQVLRRPMIGKSVDSKKYYFSLINAYLMTGSLAIISDHLGLYWVAIEATTLCLVPLIIYYRDPDAIEGMWKYLFIVSVGVAMAFIGILLIALSARDTPLKEFPLRPSLLKENAEWLNPVWIKAGFIFFFVGLSTKIGIAPMHSGDVDATSNAPSPVAGLMAASLRIVALMGVLRVFAVLQQTPVAGFAKTILLIGGSFSVFVAFVFIHRSTHLKRLLAYSSVEHLGLVSIGIGTGGLAFIGALYHLFYNALTKLVLFLNAGNMHWSYKTTDIDGIRGVLKNIPWTGWLFLLSFFAVSATPPFGLFYSELMIFGGLLSKGYIVYLFALLLFLLLIFIGMGKKTFSMLYKDSGMIQTEPESFHIVHAASLVLIVFLVMTGFAMPDEIQTLIYAIAEDFGIQP